MFCLLVIWVLFLWADSSVTVSSQNETCAQPGYLWTNPLRQYWKPNFGNVIVKVDSRFNTQYPVAPDARIRIAVGHAKWNGVVCSGVTFTDFGEKTFTQAELIDPAPLVMFTGK